MMRMMATKKILPKPKPRNRPPSSHHVRSRHHSACGISRNHTSLPVWDFAFTDRITCRSDRYQRWRSRACHPWCSSRCRHSVDPDAEVGTPDNLLAHSAVLDAIAVHAPVLPMAFGTIIPSEAELIQNVLLPNENEHSALLEHFTGSVQFTVRARYLRDEVLADLVAENPDVARLRETIAGTTETQPRQARIQLGELIVQAFDQIRPHHAEHIVTAIQPVVQQMQQREVGQVEDVVELAVLVSSDEVKRFEDALESVASELHARIDFQLLGPQAPYDFVGIDE